MRRKFVTLATGLALLWPTGSVSAREPLRLKPAAAWVLGYAEESCRLGRTFGQGDHQVTLLMTQFEPGDHFLMTLVGNIWIPTASDLPLELKVRFGPNEQRARPPQTPDGWGTSGRSLLPVNGGLRLTRRPNA